jgi:HPt (histidine-containing phosphotransfer) domain-containing protein
MDIQMPVLDGIGAMQQIRRLFAARGNVSPPPIIAMTANALAGDREHYLAEGMDDYLAKPLRPVELQALIERVLPAARGAAKANVTKSSSDTSRTVAPAIALKAAPVSASVPTSVAPSSAPASTPSLASAINPSNDNAKDMPPILDLEQLEDMRGLPAGDDSEDSGANGLIELFRSKSEERMTAMEQALVQSDWMSLGDTAHSLRGAASSVGFPRVAAACKTLELASRRLAPKASMPVQATNAPLPTHADMDEMFDEIRLRFYEANQALTKWLQTVWATVECLKNGSGSGVSGITALWWSIKNHRSPWACRRALNIEYLKLVYWRGVSGITAIWWSVKITVRPEPVEGHWISNAWNSFIGEAFRASLIQGDHFNAVIPTERSEWRNLLLHFPRTQNEIADPSTKLGSEKRVSQSTALHFSNRRAIQGPSFFQANAWRMALGAEFQASPLSDGQ